MMWFSGSKKNTAQMETGIQSDGYAPGSAEYSGGSIDPVSTVESVNSQANQNSIDSNMRDDITPPGLVPPAIPLADSKLDHSGNNQTINRKREYRASGRQRCGGIALALGGGVARGWAHIGVLRAVDEFGLPVSMIAGTSIGAMVGGTYLAGKLDHLEEFARSLTRSSIMRYLDFTLRGSGLITGSKLARRMEEHMDDVLIEDLSKPFVAVSTEIQSGHEVWLSDGPIVPALRASYALPGVFSPVVHGGRQLVDGALVNPVPVSVCRAFEPDLVIAVNLNAETFGRGTVIRPSHYEHGSENAPLVEHAPSGSWLPFLSAREKTGQIQNRLGVTAVMVESFNIIQDRIARARLAGDPPDFTIRPKLKTVGLIEFHKADEAIKAGYDEMMARLKELEEQGVFEGIKARV